MIKQYDLSFLNLNQIYKTLQTIQTRDHGLLENGCSSYNYGSPILNYPELKSLKLIIQKYIDLYHPNQLKIINSWYNTMQPGVELKIHKHEESIVSGAFYVSVGKNSVPLIFSSESVQPYSGLLILFPSEINHYTEKEKETRTVISFNTDYL